MQGGNKTRPQPETGADNRDTHRIVPDGGVQSISIPTDESTQYSRSLEQLSNVARLTFADGPTPDDGTLVGAIRSFLTQSYTGSAHRSGLRAAIHVATEAELTPDQFEDIEIAQSPEASLFRWTLENNTGSTPELPADAFEFCMVRDEWQTLLVNLVVRDRAAVGLSDGQLTELFDAQAPIKRPVPFVETLRARGRADEARAILEVYFEETTGTQESAVVLAAAKELGIESGNRERIRASLHRWRPDDGVGELTSLVKLGREERLHNAILMAIERWLRTLDDGPVSDEHRTLLTAAVDALVHRDGTGNSEAVLLYRRYLYPAESLQGIGPDLYNVATEVGDDEVASDVLTAYDLEESASSFDNIDNAVLKARVMERREAWADAYELWQEILDHSPSEEFFGQAIENRLQVLELDNAADLIDKLAAETDAAHLAEAYRVRVAEARGDYRRVIDLVDKTPEVLELSDNHAEPVAEVYLESLAEDGRWSDLREFLESSDLVSGEQRRFYANVAHLMEFAKEASDTIDGATAMEKLEQLLTAPLTTEQLEFLLNLGVTQQVANRVRTDAPDGGDRLEVVEGLVEILVSLHAERLIELLDEHGVRTDDYEEMLADVDLRRGGRQLLSTLNRDVRRQGISTNTDGNH